MQLSGSDILLRELIRHNTRIIFGIPGGANMPIYSSLYDMKNQLHHVLVRHEQGAAFAAIGYARATNGVGVCMATSGPGAINLVTGISDAMLDSIPLVCVTGQVAKHILGSDAFQETDIMGMTVPITKWNYQVTRADEIQKAIAKAYAVATSGRPGPVLIDITKNAQIELADYHPQPRSMTSYKTEKSLPVMPSSIEQAAQLLNDAERPLILFGHGVKISSAEEELLQLSEKGNFPVAATLHGLSSFPSKHKLFKGLLGMHGNYAPNILSNHADVVLAVGMRFDDRVTGELSSYLTNTQVIHIEIDSAEINKNVKTAVSINADAKEALQALIPLIKSSERLQWEQQFDQALNKEKEKVIDRDIYPESGEILMGEFVRLLSDKTAGEALIVTDVGQHQMVAARYYQFNKKGSHFTSGGLGTMGFSLPAAIGAKLAAHDRLVVSISGDGGFQMNMQELDVIQQENLDVKIVILNNGGYGMLRQWQELFDNGRYMSYKLPNPKFVDIAKAYGIPGQQVTRREDLDEAVNAMLESPSSYLLEVCVKHEENVFPMVPSGASVTDIRLQ